jgi:PST family polysaccharide transporter
MLKFGSDVAMFDLVNYFQRNLDNLLIGRWCGTVALGHYSRAYALLMLPITSIRGPIIAVAYPALSRLATNPDSHRDYYLKTTGMIAGLSMPIAGLSFVVAKPLIEVLLGPGWSEVPTIFSAFALAALVQPTAGFAGTMLLSLGQTRTYLKCGTFNAVVISISFIIGLQWGPLGVAIGYTVANYLVLWPWLHWAHQRGTSTLRDFVAVSATPLICAAVAAAASFQLMASLPATLPAVALGLAASSYGLIYVGLLTASSAGRRLLNHYRAAVNVVAARLGR